jgi:hypothetical protein
VQVARVRLRQQQRTPGRMRGGGGGQRTAHGTQLAGEAEFAEQFERCGDFRARRHLRRSEQDADGDGEIEAPAILRQIGRCEVHGDATGRKLVARIHEGGAHAFFAFFDLGGRQTDDGEGRQPCAEMHFDVDRRRSEAVLRATGHS